MIFKPVYITGFMGSGKSTIGRNLADKLVWRFIDTDEEIEAQFGKEIKDIFAQEGESWFRQQEFAKITELSQIEEPIVIALGGGALISPKIQNLVLKQGILIYIKSSPEEIYKRIKDSTRRPLLRKPEEVWDEQKYFESIKNLLKERQAGYAKAHIVFNRDGLDADSAAGQLVPLLKSFMSEQVWEPE